jgi:hypothetical protein
MRAPASTAETPPTGPRTSRGRKEVFSVGTGERGLLSAAAGDGEGWRVANLPNELVAKVLELLQAAEQEGGFGFSQASATVRLVCAAWKALHDAVVTRLVHASTPMASSGVFDHGRAGATVPSLDGSHGGVDRVQGRRGMGRVDGRGHASSEQLHCAQQSRPPLLRQGNRRGVESPPAASPSTSAHHFYCIALRCSRRAARPLGQLLCPHPNTQHSCVFTRYPVHPASS